ncbi:Endo-1,3-1,4-beta-glycanase ExsH [Hartmannibacter diazotrophicus]|uniref:Endo-1,3-1,4-beta-glycanase ExsH n=1 Tax=Hartmannibacter diazotrophicus TaxID=1482074 RepID=A0A2C9DCG9_9HYPH|nr:glycoside hydrolase family 16 protein [Hartmannibacter diazotrophicus]SON57997.1 Endo-1,3-1,4-beta-glycanase ExsH [Hartmannibacter diazotrophicus]
MKIQRRQLLVGSAGSFLLPLSSVARSLASEAPLIFDFSSELPEGTSFRRAGPAALWQGESYALVEADVPRFEAAGPDKAPALLLEGDLQPLIRNVDRLAGGQYVDRAPMEGEKSFAVTSDGTAGSYISVDMPEEDMMLTASVFVVSQKERPWAISLRSPESKQSGRGEVTAGPQWRRVSASWPSYVTEKQPLTFYLARPYALENRPGPETGLVWAPQVEAGWRPSSPVPSSQMTRAADEAYLGGHHFRLPEATVTMRLPAGGTQGGVLLDGENGNFRFGINNSGRLYARIGELSVEGFDEVGDAPDVLVHWSANGIGVASVRGGRVVNRAFTAGNPGTPDSGATVRLLAAHDGTKPSNTHIARIEIARTARFDSPVAAPVLAPPRYKMVFADEFDDPDVSRINEEGTGPGKGPYWCSKYRWPRLEIINEEKQVYMDRTFAGTGDKPLGIEPFSIADSILTITADRADPNTVRPFINDAAYTSGAITSVASHSQTYGYFEINCRVPAGRGFWPAFWLLPVEFTWPPEIDVLEGSGARRFSFSTGAIGEGSPFQQVWHAGHGDTTESFHVYALEWTQSEIILFVDGKELRRGKNFVDQPMYVLANLAVGSHDEAWIPDPDETTPFPGRFEIDYIRCWARA